MSSIPSDLIELVELNSNYSSIQIENMYKDLKENPKLTKFLDFIIFLIKFSPYYIMDLHSKKFELKLLDLIVNSKDLELLPLIGQFVMILGEFSQYISSEELLKASLNLLQLSEDKYISNLHSSLVLSFNDTINTCAARPKAFFSLTPDAPTLEVTINPKTYFQNCFNIGQWINIPDEVPDSFNTHLFTFLLDDKEQIRFSVTNNEIFYEVWRSSNMMKLPNTRVQSGTWVYVIIDFERIQNYYLISAVLNGKRTPQVQVQLDSLTTGTSKIHFIGSHDLTPNWPMLGSMCINLPLDDEFLSNLYKFGPRFMITNDESYQLVPNFSKDDDVIISALKSDDISIKFIGQKQKLIRCIFDILIDFSGVQTLIPLFSMIDKFCSAEDEIQSFMIMMIELIMKILQTSKLAQDQFVKVSGFRIIARFLIDQRHQNLTYGFYKKCYSLYKTIEDKVLKKQILKTIILNYALWAHATNEQLKLVTRHWARIVFSEHIEEAMEVKPFETILSSMRTYFWYTEEKGEHTEYGPSSDNPRDPTLSISVIRSNITQILYNIAIRDFKENYLTSLIGHCVTIPDSQQVNDLIVLVKLLALNEDQPYQKVTEHLSAFLLLHHLLNNSNSTLVFNCLEVFAALHVTGSIKDIKENIHSSILMDFIPPNFFNYENFSMIVPLVMKYPDFVTLMFYMMTRIDDNQCVELVMTHLEPNFDFGKKKEWCIWPIITALTKRGEYGDFVMKFIAESTEFEWSFSFSAIEVCGRALGVSYEEYQGLYMKYLTLRLLEHPLMKFQEQHKFWDLATFFMFYRPSDSKYSLERNVLHSSVFESHEKLEMIQKIMNQTEKIEKFTRHDFQAKICEMNDDKYVIEYKYGLRFSDEGKWLDSELGLLLCKQACRTKCETFHNTSCIFAAFSLADRPKESFEAISTLINMKVSNETYLNLIQHRDKRYLGKQINTDCIEQLLEQTKEYNEKLMKHTKVVTKKLERFSERVLEKMDLIFTNSDTETNSMNYKDTIQFAAYIANLKQTFRKDANRLIKYATSIGAPWELLNENNYKNMTFITRTCGRNFIPMEAISIKDLKDSDIPLPKTIKSHKLNEKNSEKLEENVKSNESEVIEKSEVTEKSEEKIEENVKINEGEVTENSEESQTEEVKIEGTNQDSEEIQEEFGDISQCICEKMEKMKKEKIEEYKNKPNLSVPKFEVFNEKKNFVLPAKLHYITNITEEIIFSVLSDSFEIRYVSNNLILTFDNSNVKKVMFREIDGLPIGLEVFTTMRESYLVILENFNSLTVLNSISKLKGFESIEVMTKKPSEYVLQTKITERWLNYELTTFDYLSILNDISGRSFNKLSIYPLMPNVNTEVTQYYNTRNVLDMLGNVQPYKSILKDLGDGKIDKNLVKNVSSVNSYYPPEFYSSTVCLPNNVTFMEKGDTILDFIRKNNEKLERNNDLVVSFIDRVFGIYSNYKSIDEFDEKFVTDVERRADFDVEMSFIRTNPVKLFDKEHPKRKPFEAKEPVTIETNIEDIKSAKIIPEQRVSGCASSLVVIKPHEPIMRYVVTQNMTLFTKETNMKLDIGDIHRNCISDISHTKTAIGNRHGEIYVLFGDETVELCGSYYMSPIKLLVAGTEHIASVHESNFINVWSSRSPYNHLYILPSFRGNVTSVFLDSEASLLVIGHDSKSISVFSLTLGEIIKEIDLDFVPLHICVAGISSFIYCSNGNKLCAFTNNGQKFGEREFNSNISWIGGSKNKVCVLTSSNEIYIIDFVSLKGENELLIKPTSQVMEISFATMPNIAAAITEKGEIIVIPFSI